MNVLLISGKAGHGKDTVANFMKDKLEREKQKVLVIKFGDAVKWLASKYFDFDGKKDTLGRNTLQWLGTEVLRAKYPTYWAEIVSKFISACDCWDWVLIPDLRFFNELSVIKNFNDHVYTIRVERYNSNGDLYINTNMDVEQRNHISETELDTGNFDYWIKNNGHLSDLAEKSYEIVEIIKHREKEHL